jgi:hypothetical protein
MLVFYILYSESLVKLDQPKIVFEGIDTKTKVKVVWLGKFKVKYINNKMKFEVVWHGKFEVEYIKINLKV